MIHFYTNKERLDKSGYMMSLLSASYPGESRVLPGSEFEKYPEVPAFVQGQLYDAERIMRYIHNKGGTFFQIDNGYFHPSKGRREGYLKITKNKLVQNEVDDSLPSDRFEALGIELKPVTEREYGKPLIVAQPGQYFGKYMDLNVSDWADLTVDWLRTIYGGPVFKTYKGSKLSTKDALQQGCYGLVTYASNVAVDSILAGVPVWCDEMCQTALISCPVNESVLNPYIPTMDELQVWANTLAYNQFNFEELKDGTVWEILMKEHEELN